MDTGGAETRDGEATRHAKKYPFLHNLCQLIAACPERRAGGKDTGESGHRRTVHVAVDDREFGA